MAKKYSLEPVANHRQERNKLSQLGFIQMAKLFPVNLVNPVLHLFEQVQSGLRDPRDNISAILATSVPRYEPRLFEPIEQARHIGHLPDHSLSDLAATQTIRFRPSQDAKHVVLRGGDAMRLQRAFKGVLQQGRSPLNTEMRLLFQALERPYLFQLRLQLRWHVITIRVITRIVKSDDEFRRSRVQSGDNSDQTGTGTISVVSPANLHEVIENQNSRVRRLDTSSRFCGSLK